MYRSAELQLRAAVAVLWGGGAEGGTRGSYVLYSSVRYSCVYAAHVNPALNKSSVLQHFKCVKYAME